METFRKVLKDCNLVDVGFSGNWFLWERGNLLEKNIQERLDRGVATDEWLSLFPESQIQHLSHSFSDRCPLLITTKRKDKRRIDRSLKFEAWWVMEESFIKKFRNIWENSTRDLLSKLKSVKRGLQRWADEIRYSRKEKKEVLTFKLKKLLEDERSDENLAELIDTKIELNFEIEKDERYWEQRTRVNWLKL
ncbi:uncharacterized protein LOC108451102 [Gossypium arboreum]|uniref:Reverse transcriptase n=1 Tax=Gossypium arboreum TaxID=29729 RepID=A0ABR0P010_GOSAR|nr:uncharacterized protein LOC108451102 [Gossypium arboreum]KAK5811913.1 hypothetical protein PVK06_027298 [Gossypium arboreum]